MRVHPASSRLRASARNVLELIRFGRLGEDQSTPFDLIDQGPHHRLRRYAATGSPLLLVPPLMVTADVYDIAPEDSAVGTLMAHGIAPWLVDFGAPEHEVGGMKRSLDDHIRAVVRAIERARALLGRDIHLAGYSQGGMFAYQAAAFLRGKGIKSIITFGSPVDIHKNVPALRSDLASAALKSLFPITDAVLSRIEGLPGKLTSTAFKIVSTRKEIEQRLDFLRSLHDRERIMKREARRRFLGGAGFVAWPGPAFRAFVEDFVVHNRMLSGGFVIDGRSVSLADLSCPILAFLGGTDEIARPATVRAIVDAAPAATVRFMTIPAGHFGLVVGSRAKEMTWPAVAEWIDAIEQGKAPVEPKKSTAEREDDLDPGDLDLEIDLFLDVAARAAKGAWNRLGDVLASASDTADTVRWQEPRLRRLARIEAHTEISASKELARRAHETPEATFFLWQGRAFSYAQADLRVSNVARGLYASGIRKGDRVGIVMGSRPSFLTAQVALCRLGATAVIAPPGTDPRALFEKLNVGRAVVDVDHLGVGGAQLLLLGAGHRPNGSYYDLETLDPETIPLPHDVQVDAGRAADVTTILLRPTDDGALRPMPVTNHRWALSAIGAAAATAIKPDDTVFCSVPLHHPTGVLVSTGAALVGGARLALAERCDLTEIRRVGATVVFYAGEMLRPLLELPSARADRHLPVRVFAGSGMRPALARRLRERFNVDTMELYAGTAHRAILADATGKSPGSLGSVLPGSAEVMLVKYDFEKKQPMLDPKGDPIPSTDIGLLAVREDEGWLITNDVLRIDSQSQYWFVDSLSAFVTPTLSLRQIEDALYTLPEIRLAAAWESNGNVHAAYESDEEIARDRLTTALAQIPIGVHVERRQIPLTEGFRPDRQLLQR